LTVWNTFNWLFALIISDKSLMPPSKEHWRDQETHGVADSATLVAESATPWVSCSQMFWTVLGALRVNCTVGIDSDHLWFN